MKIGILWIAIIASLTTPSSGYSCDKTPKNTLKPKPNLEKYLIEFSGNPKDYVPGENYTITLMPHPSTPSSYFTEFTILAEPEDPTTHQLVSVGRFIPIDPMLATYTYRCPNAVVQTQKLRKSTVDVLWRAPPAESGCIAIKATVVESSDSWYSEDGDLTKILCPGNEKNEDIQPPVYEYCSACDEAKYEIAFQGMWSRNTHPKDFPSDMWTAKLGDIVGASHKYGRSFWNYGAMASPGLQTLAETGDTKSLETELIDLSNKNDLRTIVKARELSPPNITGTSYTVFRVDQDNHLLSLVAKIVPSPDWIVGVANLELCSNGSWTKAVTLNLYPWDVGTDDGLAYDSPDSPSMIKQPIRRIKSNSPNREESPFYSKDGKPIKPIAKLHVTRLKLYEKVCDSHHSQVDDGKCSLTEWGDWSSCSVTCGQGFRTRDRRFQSTEQEEICDSIDLQETEICEVEGDECDAQEEDCSTAQWSNWSECSVTCGTGTKERTRIFSLEEDSESSCKRMREIVECYNPPCEEDGEDSSTSVRFTDDVSPDSHTLVLSAAPDGPVVDCKVSDWSSWQPCSATEPCTRGYQYKQRRILVHDANGGKPCPSKLQKRKRCKVPCSEKKKHFRYHNDEKVDCKMGPWSSWSPCSNSCGNAVQQKTREILIKPKNGGAPCGTRIIERSCPLPLACHQE